MLKSSLLLASTTALSLVLSLDAAAECTRKKGAPARYALEQLPDVSAESVRSEAVDILPTGDILIRAYPALADRYVDNYILRADGTPELIENSFGVGMIDVETLHTNGYQTGRHYSKLPTDPTTTVTDYIQDGQGGGLPMFDFCKSPEGTDAKLKNTVLSENGEYRVGHFQAGETHLIASCAETGSDTLFQSSSELELQGVSNSGMAAGVEYSTDKRKVWTISDDGKVTYPFGDDAAATIILDMNASGQIAALQFEQVVDKLLLLTPGKKNKIEEIDIFEEDGWSASTLLLGECGEMIGTASYTAYEEYTKLSPEKRAEIRYYTDKINDWDSRRASTLFAYSPKDGTRELKDALSMEPGWGEIEFFAAGADGTLVGHAIDPEGVQRAVKLEPIR